MVLLHLLYQIYGGCFIQHVHIFHAVVWDLHHAQDQALISPPCDHAAQPQTGTDHDCHCQPDHFALPLDPNFIYLHMFQISGLLYQMCVHLLTMSSGSFMPARDCLFAQMICSDNDLQRVTMRNQGHHDDHPFSCMVQLVEWRASRGGKGLIAYFALVTCFFSAVNNNVVLTYFAPCGAGHIRAELFSRVHVACS